MAANDPHDSIDNNLGVLRCGRHKLNVEWRRYDALPRDIKLAFQNAMTDWCVSCFVRDYPLWMVASAVAQADEEIKGEFPYGRLVQARRPQARSRR